MSTQIIQAIAIFGLAIVAWLTGTFFVAKRAKGLHERRFVIQAAVGALLGILAFVMVEDLVFKSSGHGFGGFGGIMVFVFVFLRRRQLQIRRGSDA